MGWTESLRDAISYMEAHLTEELTIKEIAQHVHYSPYYFQKGFALLCGFTVSEYLRCRRLALAASELVATEQKIIEIALKYGYQSPDSFTKAFLRFHGCTPREARNGHPIKSFAPLSIKFSLEGGNTMAYKIVEKDAFQVIGVEKTFAYENAAEDVPQFWQEFQQSPKAKEISPQFGINSDETMAGNEFTYLIGDYAENRSSEPKDFIIKEIPAFTWAIFSCKGPMPETMPAVNRMIYEEWLPNSADYEIAAGYCVERYEDPANYPKGVVDPEYEAEIWIPVKKRNR